jgi:hypothetical protein
MNWLSQMFSGANFTPHGYCIAWDPDLLAELIIANVSIWFAYSIIPIQLFRLISRAGKERIWLSKKTSVIAGFAAFIWLCGGTHLIDVLVLFAPLYWFQAHWDVLTAAVSLVVAGMIEVALHSEGDMQ